MSLDDSDDDLLPPPPKTEHKDPSSAPAINFDDDSDDDDLTPPPKSNNNANLGEEESLVLPPKNNKPSISLSDDDLDIETPPPKPAATKASGSPSSASLAPQQNNKAASSPSSSPPSKSLGAPAGKEAQAMQTRARAQTKSGAGKQKKVSEVSLEAFLFKQSPSWPYSNQRRWVTLRGRVLTYYEDKTSTAPSGTLDLKGAQVTESPPAAKAAHAIGISGESAALKGRMFIFSCTSREEYLQWLEACRFVVQEPRNNELHWFEKMAQGLY